MVLSYTYYIDEHMNRHAYVMRKGHIMRKVFKLDGELCANCAGKIQAAAEKLPGVNKVSVNAMTYKLTVDAEDDAFEGVVDQIVKLFADIEPDCEIVR